MDTVVLRHNEVELIRPLVLAHIARAGEAHRIDEALDGIALDLLTTETYVLVSLDGDMPVGYIWAYLTSSGPWDMMYIKHIHASRSGAILPLYVMLREFAIELNCARIYGEPDIAMKDIIRGLTGGEDLPPFGHVENNVIWDDLSPSGFRTQGVSHEG